LKASKSKNWFQTSFQQPKSSLQNTGINIPTRYSNYYCREHL